MGTAVGSDSLWPELRRREVLVEDDGMEPTDEQGGLALTFEPLLAIAGGIMGGVVLTSALWGGSWIFLKRKAGRFHLDK